MAREIVGYSDLKFDKGDASIVVNATVIFGDGTTGEISATTERGRAPWREKHYAALVRRGADVKYLNILGTTRRDALRRVAERYNTKVQPVTIAR